MSDQFGAYDAFLSQVAELLKSHGTVQRENLTWPSAVSTSPDLVFVPGAGPYSNTFFVIEYKRARSETLPEVHLSSSIDHVKQIEKANPNLRFHFAVCSNATVPSESKRWAEKEGLRVIDRVKDPQQLARQLISWSTNEPAKP
jgi:hypothetical protein